MSTYDARVWSINAKTGELDKNFKDNSESAGGYITTADGDAGYYLTQAPVFIPKSLIPSSGVASGRNIIIIGNAGGEHQTRGHISAYDADNGELLWRFYTVPSPREYGGDTWPNVTTGIFKKIPTLGEEALYGFRQLLTQKNGLVIFGTGNAGPDLDGTRREGANLFTASIVAANVATGQRVWHFQQVHHDLWDYDQGSSSMIFNLKVNGKDKTIVGAAGKPDGITFLILKQVNYYTNVLRLRFLPLPQLLILMANPKNRIKRNPCVNLKPLLVKEIEPSRIRGELCIYLRYLLHLVLQELIYPNTCLPHSGHLKFLFRMFGWNPSVYGGSDFPPLSHSPLTGLSYIPANIGPTNFTAVPDTSLHDPSKGFGGGGYWSYGRNKTDTKEEWSGQLVAYDPLEGKVKWIHKPIPLTLVERVPQQGIWFFMPETVETSDVNKNFDLLFSVQCHYR